MTPRFLLDENTAPPVGGGSPASAQVPGAGSPGSDGAPVSPIPDSPAEPPAQRDAFAGMENEDFDLVEVEVGEPPQPGEGGQVPPPAESGEPKPATAEPSAPQAPPPPAQPPAATADSAPQSPLEQAIVGFRTNHKQLSEWASKELFALSKDDADGLETDVAKLIPLLMGRVYSQTLQATTNLIKHFVPNMINEGVASSTARSAKAQEALSEFYQANPHLNHQQHGALVDKWARAFRAANPAASRAAAIKFVGQAVSAEVGVHASAPGGGNGAAPRRAAPFAPARPGARVQQSSPPHDPYEGMDMEFDQE